MMSKIARFNFPDLNSQTEPGPSCPPPPAIATPDLQMLASCL